MPISSRRPIYSRDKPEGSSDTMPHCQYNTHQKGHYFRNSCGVPIFTFIFLVSCTSVRLDAVINHAEDELHSA